MQTSPEGLAATNRARELLFKFIDDMTIAAAESRGVAQQLFHAVGQNGSAMAALLTAELDRQGGDYRPEERLYPTAKAKAALNGVALNHVPNTPADEPSPRIVTLEHIIGPACLCTICRELREAE